MVNRVVATKLSEEEHALFLDACNQEGCTPSAFIKKSILEKVIPEEKKDNEDMTIDDLRKYVGLV